MTIYIIMSQEDSLAHCKVTTGTQSMCYNSVSQRFNSTNIMNYTNRVINNIDLKTDTVRVSFVSITGVEQLTEGATDGNWTNVFSDVEDVGVWPTISTFNPKLSTNWENVTLVADELSRSSPKYNGDAQIVSLFGHVVLRQADAVQSSDNIQLSIWTKKAATVVAPSPTYKMLSENPLALGTSPIMGIAIADRQAGANKSTATMTVNVIVPIAKGESIQLRIRNSGSGQVNYLWLQADLFCRPIELHGTDKNV